MLGTTYIKFGYLITLIMLGKEHERLCTSLSPSRNFIPSRPKYLPQHTLILCSPLNMRDQVPHPHKTTGNSIVGYILILTIFSNKSKKKKYCGTKGNRRFLNFIRSEFLYAGGGDGLQIWR